MAIGDASLLRLPLQTASLRKIAVRPSHNTARILPLDKAPCE